MPYRNQQILLCRAPHIKTSGHSSDQLTLLHFLDKKKKKKRNEGMAFSQLLKMF